MNAVKKARGLGRGLDALLGDAPALRREEPVAPSAPGKRLSTLPIEHLAPNPTQPRRHFNDDAIEELASSIRVRGLLQPILVRPAGRDAYEIVAGERRWRAAQRAGIHDVPVVIRELDDTEAAEIALIENVQRVDLNPMEEAAAYARLAEVYGRTQDEISKAVGKSRSHIANMMRLMTLTPKCRKAVEEGALSMGHARALLGAAKPDDALGHVIKAGLNVRDTEAFVRKLNEAPARKNDRLAREPSKPSVPGKKDADTRALESDLAAALGLEVSIEHSSKGSGLVTIGYRSLDQLDDICKRLMATGV
ncbi:MAG: ParB/RepB/Spo0J family partition protein [Parvularculaceae bacterium]|nr:ParB/RepB/Spo0J family partition protein [Parvularculaceae bacterium]